MLTRQGRLTALAALAALIAGRLFGSIELYVLATVLAGLVLACMASMALTQIRIDVARGLHPPRVHAGTPSRVDVRVLNEGSAARPC